MCIFRIIYSTPTPKLWYLFLNNRFLYVITNSLCNSYENRKNNHVVYCRRAEGRLQSTGMLNRYRRACRVKDKICLQKNLYDDSRDILGSTNMMVEQPSLYFIEAFDMSAGPSAEQELANRINNFGEVLPGLSTYDVNYLHQNLRTGESNRHDPMDPATEWVGCADFEYRLTGLALQLVEPPRDVRDIGSVSIVRRQVGFAGPRLRTTYKESFIDNCWIYTMGSSHVIYVSLELNAGAPLLLDPINFERHKSFSLSVCTPIIKRGFQLEDSLVEILVEALHCYLPRPVPQPRPRKNQIISRRGCMECFGPQLVHNVVLELTCREEEMVPPSIVIPECGAPSEPIPTRLEIFDSINIDYGPSMGWESSFLKFTPTVECEVPMLPYLGNQEFRFTIEDRT